MNHVLINVVGSPRKYLEENSKSLLEHIINNNKDYKFDIVIHTSFKYTQGVASSKVQKERELKCSTKEEMHSTILNSYGKLSDNVKIFIEDLDVDIGKYMPENHILWYLRQRRIKDLVEDINKYKIIISCRTDSRLIEKINLDEVGKDFYPITGLCPGDQGDNTLYASGDFEIFFMCNLNNYLQFCKCADKLWNFKDNVYYKTSELRYITPILPFGKVYPFKNEAVYAKRGALWDDQIHNPGTKVTYKGLDLASLFVNHLTHFLKEIDSNWDPNKWKYKSTCCHLDLFGLDKINWVHPSFKNFHLN